MWTYKEGCEKMKSILTVILMLFSFSSCSEIRLSPKKRGIDKEFNHYIEEYKSIIPYKKYKREFSKLHMNFSKLKGDVVGRCWWLMNGELEIEIDSVWWKNNPDYIYAPSQRSFLVYHELEHCVRKRLHTNKSYTVDNIADFVEEIAFQLGIIARYGYLKDGCPSSLMHSHMFSDICMSRHYDHYINEMKNWKSPR